MRSRDDTPPSEEDVQPRVGLPRRVAAWLIRLLIGLVAWAVIVFAVALFVVPGKTDSRPVSSRSAIPITNASFTKPDVCSGCHWDIFVQWSGTMHSLANKDPFYVGVYDLANKDTNGRAEDFCAASRCHTPAGFLAGENPFPHARMSPIAKQGVFCDFCHTVSARSGIGDASYISSPGRLKRGPYRSSLSPYHLTVYSRLHTRSDFCGMCHNVSSPITGLKLETTYDEWAASPYNARNPAKRTECQDCHMKPYAGRACATGPRRPNVFRHDFGGGNSFIPRQFGDRDVARAAAARLKSAARLSIVSARRSDGRLKLAVRVTNVGAGHSLPTGITEVRQMWVNLTVADGDRPLYASGIVGSDGELDNTTHLFDTQLGDTAGNRVKEVWRAAKVLRDHRVPAKASVLERYDIEIPADAGALTVTAVLKYRSASPQVVDLAVGKGRLTVPVIDMARAAAQVPR